MAMPDPRDLIEGKPLVDEQPDLLDVVRAQMFPQRLTHRMGAGLGHRDEHVTVQMGNDHGQTGGRSLMIAQPASPPPAFVPQVSEVPAGLEPEIVDA